MSEGAGAVKRRAQTATERDLEGLAAKREREAVCEPVADDITERLAHDPEALQTARSKRKTAERLARLEDKYDQLVHAVLTSRTKIIVAVCTAAGAIAGYLLGGCL